MNAPEIAGLVDSPRKVVVAIEPRLISLEVGAAVYGLSADELARMQDEDNFPVLRRGRRRLIPVRAADEWFAARVEATKAGAA